VCIAPTSSGHQCGGFAGLPCPANEDCVDDPNDSCDPNHGGADCSGICVTPKSDAGSAPADAGNPPPQDAGTRAMGGESCGGFRVTFVECAGGLQCVDDPGGPSQAVDGPGVCVRTGNHQPGPYGPRAYSCGGFAAFPCPTGMICADAPNDSCDPNHGGADCPGVCY
jgi:hypothetical protein